MDGLSITLLADGSSDDALLPLLEWLLRQLLPDRPLRMQFADLRYLRHRPQTLGERILAATTLYPCDVLFVHRDAEREPRERRVEEIRRAMEGMSPPHICVVPVRMTEAWLLFDEQAIRSAAGNPAGEVRLSLPPLRQIEGLPDPKERLQDLLRIASELSGRRLHKLRVSARQVAGFVDDFSPLRALPAFRCLEEEIRAMSSQWCSRQ